MVVISSEELHCLDDLDDNTDWCAQEHDQDQPSGKEAVGFIVVFERIPSGNKFVLIPSQKLTVEHE